MITLTLTDDVNAPICKSIVLGSESDQFDDVVEMVRIGLSALGYAEETISSVFPPMRPPVIK
jgi:hypothetical protein